MTSTQTEDIFIIGSMGIVHDAMCWDSKDPLRKKPVRTTQIIVYKLPPCTRCFADGIHSAKWKALFTRKGNSEQ